MELGELVRDSYLYSEVEKYYLLVCWLYRLPEKERHTTYIQDILARVSAGEGRARIVLDVMYGEKYSRLRQRYRLK